MVFDILMGQKPHGKIVSIADNETTMGKSLVWSIQKSVEGQGEFLMGLLASFSLFLREGTCFLSGWHIRMTKLFQLP